MFTYLFRPKGWSFGFKVALAALFVFSTFITVLAISIEQQARTEADRQLREYIEQTAVTRRSRLEGALQDSLVTLAESAGTSYLRPRLLRVLRVSGAATGADIVARSELTDLLRFRLVDNGQFESIIVLSPSGTVATSVYPTGATIPQIDSVGTDNSQTTSFQGAQDSEVLGETQRIVVYRTGDEDRVEIVQVLEFDNAVVGYMVGRVDVQQVLIRSITDSGDTPLTIRSYLASRTGEVLADSSVETLARASAVRSPIGQALAGQTGFASYVISDGASGLATLGYYSPVAGTALALITETGSQRLNNSFTVAVLEENLWVVPIMLILVGLTAAVIWNDVHSPIRIMQRVLNLGTDEELMFSIPALERADAMGNLTRDVVRSREQFHDTVVSLNERLAQRDRDIQATQEVARSASSQRELQKLMDEVVALIIDVFPNIYHAQIFLNDQMQEFAVLRSSTGDAGSQLLARGHRLAIGGQSVIGRTTSEGRITAVLDTQSSDVHRPNELLPNTRAELAIPLRIGQRVIGALDVQSLVANSFTAEQTTTLQIMADQIAVSLENARLYQESLRALEEIARANRDATGASWRTHLFGVRTQELQHYAGLPTRTEIEDLRQHAVATGNAQIGQVTETRTVPFAVPIRLRGQVLGAVVWELPAAQFSDEKVQLAEELVNRLAVSLDNARLFEESQRATERERLVNDIAAKISGQTAVDAILTTAVREVGQALRTSNVKVRLGTAHTTARNSTNLFGGDVHPSGDYASNGKGHSNGNGFDPSEAHIDE